MGRRRGARRWLGVAIALSMATPALAATDRMRRAIHEIPGVPAGAADVAQDSFGFIWIAGDEGLARFDGLEARRFSPDVVTEYLEYVSTGPAGAVCAGNPRGALFEVHGERAEPVSGADGRPLRFVRHAVYDTAGGLWIVANGRLLHRPRGAFVPVPHPDWNEESPFRLAPSKDGGVLVGTVEGGLWSVRGETGVPRSLARGLGGPVNRIAAEDDGGVVVIARGVGVLRIDRGGEESLVEERVRATGLAIRDGTIWAAFTEGVWVLRDGAEPVHLDDDDGFPLAGSLTFDADGGLWTTGYRGVELFPEPDTVVWTSTTASRRFRTTSVQPGARGGVWSATWEGPAFLRDGEDDWRPLSTDGWFTAHPGCVDGDGRVWASAWSREGAPATALLRWESVALAVRGLRPDHTQMACDRDVRGTTWFAYGRELLELRAGADAPVVVTTVPATRDTPSAFAVDRSGALAAAFDDELCTASGPAVPWTCSRIPDVGVVRDVRRGPDGRWWLATSASRVVAWDGSEGEPVLPAGAVRNTRVRALTRSPRGGLWVSTGVEKVRVDLVDGVVRVVERLSGWNGVPAWWSGAVREHDDGTIWLPTDAGPLRVPPTARRELPSAPSLEMTALSADGRPRPVSPILELPAGDRRVEARFSTFAYRDLDTLRYRVRTGGGPWVETLDPVVRLVHPAPGSHVAEIQASLDGVSWSGAPASLECSVAPPWYSTPPAWAVLALLVGGLAFAAHRLRLLHVVRLERQRAAIAMDLHDEVGAAVGGIGMMAGVVADPGATPDQRSAVAQRIVEAAEELGATLYDIIWSLRVRDRRASTLAAHLTERGARLFPEERTDFDARIADDLPPEPLALPVRRNVQRILLEALHNAARHAAASRVTLGFDHDRGDFVAWVEDDGIGIHGNRGASGRTGEARGAGLGLDGMRARAEEIGARLDVAPARSGGTRVTVRFRADGRRLGRLRARQHRRTGDRDARGTTVRPSPGESS